MFDNKRQINYSLRFQQLQQLEFPNSFLKMIEINRQLRLSRSNRKCTMPQGIHFLENVPALFQIGNMLIWNEFSTQEISIKRRFMLSIS